MLKLEFFFQMRTLRLLRDQITCPRSAASDDRARTDFKALDFQLRALRWATSKLASQAAYKDGHVKALNHRPCHQLLPGLQEGGCSSPASVFCRSGGTWPIARSLRQPWDWKSLQRLWDRNSRKWC